MTDPYAALRDLLGDHVSTHDLDLIVAAALPAASAEQLTTTPAVRLLLERVLQTAPSADEFRLMVAAMGGTTATEHGRSLHERCDRWAVISDEIRRVLAGPPLTRRSL